MPQGYDRRFAFPELLPRFVAAPRRPWRTAMEQLNYNHLHYFWVVATQGSITKAAELLHVTPQTISGQLRTLESRMGGPLFRKAGRKIVLTEIGRVALSYAEPMFELGNELKRVMKDETIRPSVRFQVGIAMVLPKLIAYRILEPALALPDPMRIVCHEAPLDSLLADIAVHKLDLVLTDSPMIPSYSVRAYNHLLGESGVSFFAERRNARRYRRNFPQSLDGEPFLLPATSSALRGSLTHWFERRDINPRVVAEFEDTALMNAFGEAGAGIFASPTAIEADLEKRYRVKAIGRAAEIKQRFYVVSTERRLKHPAVLAITTAARRRLFGEFPELGAL
jgi:LysR family transcriptional activator of nhaA